MKKLIIGILAISSMFCLVSCGSGSGASVEQPSHCPSPVEPSYGEPGYGK